jgi:L-fuconolactonase
VGESYEIVDAQVHLNMVGVEAGITAMDAVGVDALLIDEFWSFDAEGRPQPGYPLPGGSFRHTSPLAELAVARHPDRFAYLTRCQPDDPDIESVIGGLRDRPGRLALRLLPYVPVHPDRGEVPEIGEAVAQYSATIRGGAYDRYLALAEQHAIPLFIQVNGIGTPGDLHLVEWILRRHPGLPLVLDHMGVALPGGPGSRPQRFDQFDDIAALARYDNLFVKWGHAPRLSEEGYPYPDVLTALHGIVAAFGASRVMWASDWTIDLAFNSWAESLYCIRDDDQLSVDEKAWILGRSVRELLGWTRA